MKKLLTRLIRHKRLTVIAVVLLLAIVGVIIYSSTRSEPPQFVQNTIVPSSALQRVTAPRSIITSIRMSDSSEDEPLLIFLPATGALAQLYNDFEHLAVKLDYHVLAVPYANLRTERSICTANAECYGQLHEQQLTGASSPYLNMNAGAALEQTVISSLKTLAAQDPDGHWDNYLTNGHIAWSKVVVAGHSQGGGLAAYTAHQEKVKGVIMFSSPNDVDFLANTTATWLSSSSATADSRYFGMTDDSDSYHSSTLAAWRAMLPGVKVAGINANSQNGQQLFATSLKKFPYNLNAHFATARDPAYDEVWAYLLNKAR